MIFTEIMAIDESVELEDERTLLVMEMCRYVEELLMREIGEEMGKGIYEEEMRESFEVPVFEFIED